MAASVKIEFDDGSRVISQSLYENAGTGAGQGLSGETRPPSCKLEDFYEISKTTEFVSSGNFSRIALQFPDSLLEDAPEVLWVLESRLRKLRRMSTDACGDGAGGAIKERCEGGVPEPLMFVTGDTSYGSCCVDEVSAKHLKADAIVHYGRACLSPTSCSVPVLYVFGRGSVDVEHLAECLLSGPLRPLSPPSGTVGNASADGGESSVSAGTAVRDESTPTSPVLLLYDVTYAHAILALIHILGDDVVRNGRLVVGFPTPQAYSPSTGHRGRDGANLERDALGEVSPILNEAATAVSPVLPISGGSSTNPNAGSCCRGEGENGNSCSGAGVVGVGGESEPETAHQGKSDTPVDARNTPVLTATEDLTAILSAMTLGPSAPGVASRKRRTIRIGGLGVGLESEEALERCTLVFIGPEGRQLSNILLRCSSCRRRMRYDPSRPVADRLVADSRVGNRDLMRRYYLVQRAREAGIIGIVVGTLGVKHYGNVVRSLRRMVEDEGRKAYTLAVGKINVAKLANFAEVDVFCLVACAENSLLDSKEFHAPVVTPLELEVALGRREWDGFYSTDFDDIAELTEASREAQDRRKSPQAPPSSSSPDVSARGRIDSPEGDDDDGEDRPFFSLVTGTYKSVPGALSRKSGNPVVGTGESVGNNGISVGTSGEAGALATLSDRSLVEWVSPAAEFLNQRKFKGLEPLIGKTEAEAATEGQTGIASDYGGF